MELNWASGLSLGTLPVARNAATTCDQKTGASLSCLSRLSHPTGLGVVSAQAEISIVLPHPPPAHTKVTGFCTATSSWSIRRWRRTAGRTMLGRDILASMYRMRPDGAIRSGAVRSDGGS
jgi:hypothetical protein